MSEETRFVSIQLIEELLVDIYEISEDHKSEILTTRTDFDWQARIKYMHQSKAAAYDFVIRKIKRKFNITNNGKETNT